MARKRYERKVASSHRLYTFIKKRIRAVGEAPTIEEICQRLGYNSTAMVHELLTTLETQGLIVRTPHVGRGIRLVEQPAPSFEIDGFGADGEEEEPEILELESEERKQPKNPYRDPETTRKYHQYLRDHRDIMWSFTLLQREYM